MHRPPAPLPEPLGTVFTYPEAIAHGVTPARLRHRSLVAPTRGLRLTGSADEISRRAAAFAQLLPPRAAYSFNTAAALLCLPAPADDRLHVTVPDGVRIRRHGVVEHRGMQRRALGYINGVPATAPAQTWLDLAATLSIEELVVLGDAITHNFPDQRLQLRAIAAQNAGARGIKRVREAVELIRANVLSPQESLWRLRFRAAGFAEPELNGTVRDSAGHWLGIGDFVWRSEHVVVEYDGDYHFTVEQRRLDQARRRAMRSGGWEVIEINGADNRDPKPAMRTIGLALGC